MHFLLGFLLGTAICSGSNGHENNLIHALRTDPGARWIAIIGLSSILLLCLVMLVFVTYFAITSCKGSKNWVGPR